MALWMFSLPCAMSSVFVALNEATHVLSPCHPHVAYLIRLQSNLEEPILMATVKGYKH